MFDNIKGLSDPSIKRLAHYGELYEETSDMLKVFLENVIKDASTYTEHYRCKPVISLDVG
ncbi:966_t:CDS:2 [Entrophospora sp. SA101]|nr:966_t:CDS:2 [Entrophospora sp. SA101]